MGYQDNDVNTGVVDNNAWAVFGAYAASEEFLQSWLAIQCQFVSEATTAWLVAVRAGDQAEQAAVPELLAGFGAAPELYQDAQVQQVLSRTVSVGLGLAEPLRGESSERILTMPVSRDGSVAAVVMVVAAIDRDERIRQVMQHLQWGSGWVYDWLRRHDENQAEADNSFYDNVLRIFSKVVQHDDYEAACIALTAGLSELMDLDTVVAGLGRSNQFKIVSLSNAALVDERFDVLQRQKSAMLEAHEQSATLISPPPDQVSGLITHHHDVLREADRITAAMSIPFGSDDRAYGVVLVETSRPLGKTEARQIEAVVNLVGLVALEKWRARRPMLGRAAEASGDALSWVLGRKFRSFKVITLLLCGLVVGSSYITTDAHVRTPSQLEPLQQIAITAPFDGYVKSSDVRPGDR
ncbi:MAG: hypothetical protein AAFW74_10025, partial [Pseudomonadota bacterium]